MPTERGVPSFKGVARMEVQVVKEHSDSVVASALGVNDRSSAEALRGSKIFVSRSSFPAIGVDEYYWVDLIGLPVVNRQKESLGSVKELLSAGPQTVLVLEYLHDGKPTERMIPFVAAYVDEVDLKSRCILVDWQTDY